MTLGPLLKTDQAAKRLGFDSNALLRHAKKHPECPQPFRIGPRMLRWSANQIEVYASTLLSNRKKEPPVNTLTSSSQPTMSSLELVEFINAEREAQGNTTKLRHDDFMRKVPKVLGETVARNFSGYYVAENGKENPCYRFPKREACLMAMSYSYDLQAKVFDKMTALEQQVAAPVTPAVRDPRTAALIEALVRQDALEQEQQRQALAVAQMQESVAVLEAKLDTQTKYFSIMGWCNLQGRKLDEPTAAKLGKQCAQRSRFEGIHIGRVSDARHGEVNSYHQSVLEAVLGPRK